MILCLPACFRKKTASPYWHKSLWPISFLGPVLQGLGPHVFSRHESFAPVLFFSEDVEPWTAKKKYFPAKMSAKRAGFCCKFSIPSHLLDEGLGEVAEVAVWAVNKSCKNPAAGATSKSGAGPAHLKTKKKTCESASRQVEVLGHVWVSKIYVLEKQLVL